MIDKNHHYFLRGPLRYLEEKFGPWSWATNVQYCDASQEVPTEHDAIRLVSTL